MGIDSVVTPSAPSSGTPVALSVATMLAENQIGPPQRSGAVQRTRSSLEPHADTATTQRWPFCVAAQAVPRLAGLPPSTENTLAASAPPLSAAHSSGRVANVG